MKKTLIAFSAGLILASIVIQIIGARAAYIPSDISSGCSVSSGIPGQLIYYSGSNTNPCSTVPNSNASSTPYGFNVNLGAYANYANPSGMLNLYATSTGPILSSSFMGSTPQYVQVFLQNLHTDGSSDLVFADDKGSATSTDHYLDIGIANSTQTDAALPIIGPLDSYIFSKSGRTIIGSGAGSTASSTVIISSRMSTSTYSRYDQYGHFITKGPKPSLAGSGLCSLSSTSNDQSGTISCSGLLSLTTLTVTFANPYQASEVQCSLNNKGNITIGAYTSSVSSLGIPVTVALGGGSFTYQCQATE